MPATLIREKEIELEKKSKAMKETQEQAKRLKKLKKVKKDLGTKGMKKDLDKNSRGETQDLEEDRPE